MVTVLPPFGLGMCDPKRPKAKKKSPEKDVQRAIQNAFRLQHRVVLFETDAGNARSKAEAARAGLEGFKGHSGLPPGFSDLMGVVPGSGRALFLEVKAPGGKPTELQLAFLDRRRAEGAIAFWADSPQSALAQFVAALAQRSS